MDMEVQPIEAKLTNRQRLLRALKRYSGWEAFWNNFVSHVIVVPERDPAARTGLFGWLEIVLCYPGLWAIWGHRFAHLLWRLRIPVLPRLINRLMHFLTNVDIHPGAKIGKGVFIDHASGVVIGETAIVGDNVTLFQGVTLGGTGKKRGKRHPTVGDHALIGAGAKVLGDITIGENSLIGAGAVVVKDVPPNSTAVGIPAKVVIQDGVRVEELAHNKIPDPVLEVIEQMQKQIDELKKQIEELQGKPAGQSSPEPEFDADDYHNSPFWKTLEECQFDGGPPDLAEEHDHYIYGTLKRKSGGDEPEA